MNLVKNKSNNNCLVNASIPEWNFKKKGFTKFPNQVLEALYNRNLNGSEYQIVLAIIRKTLGWNKPQDAISRSQFEEMCSKDGCSLERAIKKLLSKGIIIRNGKRNGVIKWSVESNTENWQTTLKKEATTKKRIVLPAKKTRKFQLIRSKMRNTKRIKDKYKIEKETNSSNPSVLDGSQLSEITKYTMKLCDDYGDFYRENYNRYPNEYTTNVAKKHFKKLLEKYPVFVNQRNLPEYNLTKILGYWFREAYVSDWVMENGYPPHIFCKDIETILKRYTKTL
ncbi:MAG: replication protein [Elusimicrobia bacterium]|nr:replication protein [Elusimicrobiota bacterium]